MLRLFLSYDEVVPSMALDSMKRSLHTRLAKSGYSISKTVPRSRPALTHYDPALHAKVTAVVEAYDYSKAVHFPTPKSIMSYLDPARVNSYHQTVNALTGVGVDLNGKRVLDVGSATGYLLRIVENDFDDVTLFGTDYYEELVQVSKAIAPTAVVTQASIDELKATDERYDVIFCTEVLEHILDTETQIPTLLSMLNPGGALLVSVPHGTHDSTPAFTSDDGISFVGHVNFWTPQSWNYYIDRISKTLDYPVEVTTGTLGNNFEGDVIYAVIKKG